jgi:hypothetical protein
VWSQGVLLVGLLTVIYYTLGVFVHLLLWEARQHVVSQMLCIDIPRAFFKFSYGETWLL